MATAAPEEAAAIGAEVHADKQHAEMKKAGKVSRAYVSYGVDAPSFGVPEAPATMKEERPFQEQQINDI